MESKQRSLSDTAILYYDRKITYRELFANIESTAKSFSKIGISEGDVVAICAVTIPEVIVTLYALNLLGAVANMIDPRTNTERIIQYIADSNVKAIVAVDKCMPKIDHIIKAGFNGCVICVSAGNSLPSIKKLIYLATNHCTKYNFAFSWKAFISMGKDSQYKKSRI